LVLDYLWEGCLGAEPRLAQSQTAGLRFFFLKDFVNTLFGKLICKMTKQETAHKKIR